MDLGLSSVDVNKRMTSFATCSLHNLAPDLCQMGVPPLTGAVIASANRKFDGFFLIPLLIGTSQSTESGPSTTWGRRAGGDVRQSIVRLYCLIILLH